MQLWAGPLLSAPAETVVGPNFVEVRPSECSSASQLQTILNRLGIHPGRSSSTVSEDGSYSEDKPPSYSDEEAEDAPHAYDFVVCIGDFILRDEDIFQVVHQLAEQDKSSVGSRAGDLDMLEEPALDVNLPGVDAVPMDEDAKIHLLAANPYVSPPIRASEEAPEVEELQLDAPQQTAPEVFTITIGKRPSRANFHLVNAGDLSFTLARWRWTCNHETPAETDA
mmetsp:Transcript_38237/g.83564  ORF Transcript_38237/g.83564 Transcript_38237/m.83564 type:complete len:224 (+) Transcript_38237:2-673(+)